MELFLFTITLTYIVVVSFASQAEQKSEGPDETTLHVRAVLAGDKQAFNRLVLLYQARIYNLAYNYVKNEEEAKDVAQDVFVTAYKSLAKLRDDTKFGAWLYQIGINHCRNRYKKLKRRGYFTQKSTDDENAPIHLEGGTSPEQDLEQKRTIKFMRDTIATMNEAEREVLVLRDLQGLPYDEISELLGVPLGTVKSKLNRARLNLKNKLKLVYPNL